MCHSTVDDATLRHRPPPRWLAQSRPRCRSDRGVGPDLTAFVNMLLIPEAEVKRALEAWGPGKYDAELNRTARPSDRTARPRRPSIPQPSAWPACTSTPRPVLGNGSYWNAYVANPEITARAHSSIPASTMPTSTRSRRERGRATSRTRKTCHGEAASAPFLSALAAARDRRRAPRRRRRQTRRSGVHRQG